MKIVQSFWSGNQTDFRNRQGWFDFKYNWLSWILSCNQLIKFHKDVELYTDEFGYEILINKLKLPYTKVHVVLDELNKYHKGNWALAKIRTFQLQTTPFIHVDGDVFVWESLTDKFIDSNLITQNLEITTKYYRDRWDIIFPKLNFVPDEMYDYNLGTTNFACNMGIVGGNNIHFFKEFTSKSFAFVDNNKIDWENCEELNFNVFFEQVLFNELAKLKNEPIDFLIDEISTDNNYVGFGDFDKVPNKKYLHLLGDYKRNLSVCKAMEVYVMKYYPENYSILMEIINIESNNSDQIVFLNAKKVVTLNNQFENELRNNNFKSVHFLLKRDLYNEGLPNKLDVFLNSKQNFKIVVLKKSFKKEKQIVNEEFIDVLGIKELNAYPRFYDLDDVDNIILFEINNPISYFEFILKMEVYFDEEEEESKKEFIFLINQRLRNFIILKIISIY